MAVLGTGGVGAVLAVRYGLAGHRVLCLASPRSGPVIRERGLTVLAPDGSLAFRPEVVALLEEPVDVLVVATKAQVLADALDRVDPAAVASGAVVPLLNGIEHMGILRERFGDVVLAGSVGRISAQIEEPGRIVQHSAGALIALASDARPATWTEDVAARLRAPQVGVVVGASEAEVLWDKLVRLAGLAAATSASGLTIGGTRSSPEWRPRLLAAFEEAAAVAASEGAELDVPAMIAFVDGLPFDSSTSTSLDVAAGRPSELDAISGSVLRIGERNDVPCPQLASLVADAEERAACLAR